MLWWYVWYLVAKLWANVTRMWGRCRRASRSEILVGEATSVHNNSIVSSKGDMLDIAGPMTVPEGIVVFRLCSLFFCSFTWNMVW